MIYSMFYIFYCYINIFFYLLKNISFKAEIIMQKIKTTTLKIKT